MKNMLVLAVLVASVAWPRATVPGVDEINALLRTAVEKKQVPMAVAMVADANGVIYEHAEGAGLHAIFPIASMTKPITSTAVLQLVEAGKVRLDEPARTYVPEIGTIQVLEGGTLRPPKSPVTVRHLLTHTAGFGYEFMNKTLLDLVAKKELPSLMTGDGGFLKAPLLFDPGTRWEYGTNTDWLGRLVEQVSGQSLEVYFREHIFAPLAMPDTFFEVPADKRERLVTLYQRQPDGSLQPQTQQMPRASGFFSGGGGLHSTASDYLRFVRAIMAGGQLDGRRILSAESVAMAGRNQIGELEIRPFPSLIPQLATDGATLPGALDKFGLGFALNTTANGTARGRESLAWAGIFNTFFWIDREKQIGAVLMSQMLPGLDPGPRGLLEEFDRAVYAWQSARKSAD
ncbi:MAG TPA: serine hydrolase domain-containing protein [Vicinamibacterales bacterium]|nr:serine hydrolase domain-containing protein [Vicinamibacterales bacterium]